MPLIRAPLATFFLECWWRKLAKNQRSLPAFFLGPKAHVHDPVHVLLVGLNHMHGPMQNFLVCFGAPKLYAFPICKCYAFLNILLGYPLCLTTTHKATIPQVSCVTFVFPLLEPCQGEAIYHWCIFPLRLSHTSISLLSSSPGSGSCSLVAGPQLTSAQ